MKKITLPPHLKKSNSTLVYSSDVGRIKAPNEKSPTITNHSRDPADNIVRIHRETKGRGGKGVCIITGLNLKPDDLIKLAKKLKEQCGTGGTVKDTSIEIQGDHREKLKLLLEKNGYVVKLGGG
jgi:translation initiation factor 1